MYNYLQLSCFYINWKLDQKSNFGPEWPELGLIKASRAQTGKKCDSQESRVTIYYYYQFNLISNLNWEV